MSLSHHPHRVVLRSQFPSLPCPWRSSTVQPQHLFPALCPLPFSFHYHLVLVALSSVSSQSSLRSLPVDPLAQIFSILSLSSTHQVLVLQLHHDLHSESREPWALPVVLLILHWVDRDFSQAWVLVHTCFSSFTQTVNALWLVTVLNSFCILWSTWSRAGHTVTWA